MSFRALHYVQGKLREESQAFEKKRILVALLAMTS